VFFLSLSAIEIQMIYTNLISIYEANPMRRTAIIQMLMLDLAMPAKQLEPVI
jgi:hypothetical protein